MIKAFTIFKEGTTTTGPVTILIPQEIFTDELLQFKINKFIFLGYEVKII